MLWLVDLSRLSTTDLTGRFYLQAPGGGGRFAGYYASLDSLRPMLASAEWQAAVTGYYLNVAGNFDAVRLTYLTTTPDRVQVMAARQPYRPHFARTFERDSATYRAMPAAEQEQFWADLAHWPNPPQVDWAHMMVNMALGCDWLGDWRYFLQPQPPLGLAEINARVAEQGFAIPLDWEP